MTDLKNPIDQKIWSILKPVEREIDVCNIRTINGKISHKNKTLLSSILGFPSYYESFPHLILSSRTFISVFLCFNSSFLSVIITFLFFFFYIFSFLLRYIGLPNATSSRKGDRTGFMILITRSHKFHDLISLFLLDYFFFLLLFFPMLTAFLRIGQRMISPAWNWVETKSKNSNCLWRMIDTSSFC